ncbi:twin-arginine translocation signal domain-containing protein [Streptomyces sp. NPDC021622]|uniref:twin-arginine translocation signal domain-containing protein n=1 Tax=Streptomyces sp. NPDC021622 TaxID=3155013 RepID=UPI0033FF2655
MQRDIRGVSRRTVLAHAGIITAAAAVTSLTPSVATAAPVKAPKTAPAKVPTSANGWSLEKEANHVSTVWTRPVPGTGLKLDIRIGDAEAILLHVIRRYHYEVEQLHPGDLAGWQRIDKLNADLPESNLASGTAVRIRPGAAAKGSLFPLQVLVVRDIVADCEGLVRWGGDDNPVDESLFYIDRGPDNQEVRDVARKLRRGEATAGHGAGTTVDPLSKARRERARRLARQQTNRR